VIDGPFAVINADDYYGRGAFESLARFLAGSDGDTIGHALVGYRLSKTLTRHGTVTRGVCRVGADGLLLEIVERHRVEDRAGIVGYSDDGETWTTLPPSATVSMNMWGFAERFVGQLSDRLVEFLLEHTSAELETVEFLLPGVVGRLVAAGVRVRVLPTDEAWFGVTYREDVGKARQEIAKRIDRGKYPMRLWDR